MAIGTAGVLAYIKDEVAAGRPFPQAPQIATHFGWHEGSARDALMRLAAKGLLKVSYREHGKCGGWRYSYQLADDGVADGAPCG